MKSVVFEEWIDVSVTILNGIYDFGNISTQEIFNRKSLGEDLSVTTESFSLNGFFRSCLGYPGMMKTNNRLNFEIEYPNVSSETRKTVYEVIVDTTELLGCNLGE